MKDILVRGIPEAAKKELERMAKAQNLSLNQLVIKLIQEQLEEYEEQKKKNKEWDKAFRDVDVIRKRLAEKCGKFDDSTKSIRDDRDRR